MSHPVSLKGRVLEALARTLAVRLLPTRQPWIAAWSPFQYGQDTPDGPWTTSPLGMLNGVLPLLGFVVVRFWDSETQQPVPPYLGFRRRWWGR